VTIDLTKKVKYSANERIDLNDKTAEDSLLDETLREYSKGTLADDQDGRVFFGWRASTPVTWPTFTIAAEQGLAVARDGTYCMRDGSAASSLSLVANAINYFHAYFDETATDLDNRRFWLSGSESSQNTPTRITRTASVYQSTKPYASGTPPFSGFDASANIGGTVRQLVPLYAVVVNSSNIVEGTYDYRPMFAVGVNGQGSNLYDTAVLPDLPHGFSPSDSATLGITSLRKGLAAIADRLKNLKNSANWYSSNFDAVILNSGAHVYKSVNTSYLTLCGGSSAPVGAHITLTGNAYTLPSVALHYATEHSWWDVGGTACRAKLTSDLRFAVGDLYTGFVPTAKLQIASNSDKAVILQGANNASASPVLLDFYRARGTLTAVQNVANSDILGGLQFYGNYSGSMYCGALIYAAVDGTPGASDMPAQLLFYTAPDGSTSPQVRMTIKATGNVGIGTSTPPNKLTVQSSTQFDGLALWGTTYQAVKLYGLSSDNDGGALELSNQGRLRVWLLGSNNEWPVRLFSDFADVGWRRTHITTLRSRGDNVVQAGDYLGGLAMGGKYAPSADAANFSYGWDGGAEVTAVATQTWSAGARGAKLIFSTSADGTIGVTERLTVQSNGNIGIGLGDGGTPMSRLHIKSDSAILTLEGLNSAYIQFAPDTWGGGVKGTCGFGTGNAFQIVNYIDSSDAHLNLVPGTGARVNVTGSVWPTNFGGYALGDASKPWSYLYTSELATLGGLKVGGSNVQSHLLPNGASYTLGSAGGYKWLSVYADAGYFTQVSADSGYFTQTSDDSPSTAKEACARNGLNGVFAYATIFSAAISGTHWNAASVSHPSTGIYTITLDVSPHTDCIVLCMPYGDLFAYAYVFPGSPNTVRCLFRDVSHALVDTNFSFVVIGRPATTP